MTPFFRTVLHAGVIASTLMEEVWERVELLFCSKAEATKRASRKVNALKRKEMEVERLDRLRNPSRYQGR